MEELRQENGSVSGGIAPESQSGTGREPERRSYLTGKKEILFAAAIFLASLFLTNVTVFGGLNLGFAVGANMCILCSSVYLMVSGRKLTFNSGALLVFSMVIASSFARSDDGFVKFVMVCFLLVSVNLGLCLLAGKNRHDPGSAGILSDAWHTLFSVGFSEMGPAFGGLKHFVKKSGTVGQKSLAVLTGLGIAVPILLVIIPLLMSADAAFEAVLDILPEVSVPEIVVTVLLGTGVACVLYGRGIGLHHGEPEALILRERKRIASLTVNTALGAVGVVYIVYLFSQLLYFIGGFSGILPEGYTLAEYARRGFFEMAFLCAINLSIILFSLWIVKREERAPLSTRLLCLFIGVMTLFFVVAASAKMMMYIGSYGLTRLRLLTQIIMIYMGIVTVLVAIRLFVRKLPYMKMVILTALLIGAAVSWADVDTTVAKYNVDAYLSGKLETVDVYYLDRLGNGAIPQLVRLADEAKEKRIADNAKSVLENCNLYAGDDFRGWNYADLVAEEVVRSWKKGN